MKPLEDLDLMPFGKYRSVPMQDIPAHYLHWLWSNGLKNDKQSPVAAYIRNNLSSLRQEHPDGIWT